MLVLLMLEVRRDCLSCVANKFLERVSAALKIIGGEGGGRAFFWLEMGENYMNKYAFLKLKL
jgi:hypothetical protein